MKYDPDIHNRCSIRLKGYDYSQAGLYFIAICTQNRLRLFGEIVDNGNGATICAINEYGKITETEWIKTPEIRPNIELGEFVIMPHHMHGIIRINRHDCRGVLQYAPTGAENETKFCSPSQTIGAIIRGYKSSVTKQINILRNKPGVPVWQRNYYEHIIRDEKSYCQLSEYIRTNPLKWQTDKYYD